jgi:integrase
MKIRSITVKGVDYWQLDVGLVDGKRVRHSFRSRKAAEKKRGEIEESRNLVGKRWTELDGDTRQQTLTILAEMATAGITLPSLWNGYKVGLIKPLEQSIPLGDAIKHLLKTKREGGRREAYADSLEYYLNQFAHGRERTMISAITADTVTKWLGKFTAQWTRRTWVTRLGTLFRYAHKRKWITENPILSIDTIRIDAKPPTILSVPAARVLLRLTDHKAPDAAAYIVLAMFCGVRPNEIRRLSWADLDLDQKFLTIDAAASKVRSRRIVTIPDCAVAWLKRFKECPLRPKPMTLTRRLRRLSRLMGAKRIPADILRHTAASYLIAVHGARLTAEWLGNSETILYRHYRQLVTREEADKFWALTPAACGCVRPVKTITKVRRSRKSASMTSAATNTPIPAQPPHDQTPLRVVAQPASKAA